MNTSLHRAALFISIFLSLAALMAWSALQQVPTAVAASAKEQSLAKPKQLKKVRISLTAPTISVLPVYIAQKKGYYAEEGLEVDLIQTQGGVDIKAMIAGDFDMSTNTSTAMIATAAGAAVTQIFCSLPKPLFWLYSQPQIRTVQDLKGKKIGSSGSGNAMEMFTSAYVGQNSLDSVNDIFFINIGVSPQQYAALKNKSIDAAIFTPPYNVIAKRAGYNELIAYPAHYATAWGGLATTGQVIKQKPDVVKGVVKASLKGLKLFKQNKQQSLPLLMEFLNLDQDVASAVYDTVVGDFNDTGVITNDKAKQIVETQKAILHVEGDLPVDKAFDLSFANEANRQLQSSGWKP